MQDLLLQGFVRARWAVFAALVFLLFTGALAYALADSPADRAGWVRAMMVRTCLLTPIWGAVLLLGAWPRALLAIGPWVTVAVPLSVFSFTLEIIVGGPRGAGELRLIIPVLIFVGVGVLFSWASRTLLPVTAASLLAGPLTLHWCLPQTPEVVRWNLWAVWLASALFLLIGCRRREWAERELLLRRERQDYLMSDLQAANEDLRQLSHQRNEFLALAAHDLRNPLTIIVGNAAALEDGTLGSGTQEAREALSEIVTSGEQMKQIVERCLIEPRRVSAPATVKPRKHSTAALLHLIAGRVQPLLRRKAQTLEIVDRVPGLGFFADPGLLSQALENLVTNASKFSPVGSKVWLEATHLVPENATRLAVRDQGPGVSEEDRRSLFQRGVRLSAQPTAGEPSSGVGLSLVKSWVEIMGGTVGCDSQAGGGATFWILIQHAAVTPFGAHRPVRGSGFTPVPVR